MNPSGRLLAMAFDMTVGEDGTEYPDESTFYTPNEYVLKLAAKHEALIPCASVHPYRVDALDRLDAAAEAGARAIKWLPNSMGIDPSSPKCDAFYRRVAELDLPIITHGGREYAVDSAPHQEFGNPLLLRRALDAGVRIVVAHCASFGTLDDLDHEDAGDRQAAAFDLFMRLFTDPQYEANLFADISGLTLMNRSSRVLRELLMATEVHHRLLNGSDYPIPALHILYSTLKLQWAGFLDERERTLANEIAPVNALLFDFVVKRSLRVEQGGKTYRFPHRVFETDWFFA
jgi:mannonate dehydratase